MDPLAELELLLRPAGGGLYVVSTGRAEQLAVQRLIYGASGENEVADRWREALAAARGGRLLLLGVPSDVGAGFRRGASEGPQAIRARLAGDDPGFWRRAADRGVVDVGDVLVVPQLLEDEMLSEGQKAATRRALYPGLPEAEVARLPVAPLSIAGRALELLLAAAPGAVPVILGGDHSVAWPAVERLAALRPGLAVLHVDAHTDLLPERLGVRHCFSTWAFHANELLGRGGRLVQVGLRASRHDRAHWESSLGVRQIWAEEVRRDPERALDAAVEALRAAGARSVYLSNDVDGTDAAFADATGTPEPDGLHPDFVCALLRRAARELPVAGADLVEVAPALAPGGRTLETAARYLRETIEAILGESI
ncbi:MAG TPA: arginase family protein [Anaeromyxobacteraceae bacterium]